jgi:hypothetical protein
MKLYTVTTLLIPLAGGTHLVNVGHGSAAWVAIPLVTPVILLTVRWIGLLISRELFARKAADVRKDLLALVALERADTGAKSRSSHRRSRAKA